MLQQRACGKFYAERQDRLWQVIENAPELSISYDDLQFLVNQDLDLLEAEERSQRALRERITERYAQMDPCCHLLSAPGFGAFLAAAITGRTTPIDVPTYQQLHDKADLVLILKVQAITETDAKAREYARFVDDLKIAADLLRKLAHAA